jgi:hypothetical protein
MVVGSRFVQSGVGKLALGLAVVVASLLAIRGIDSGGGIDREPGFDSPGEAMEWILLAHRDENGQIPRDGLMRARAQVDRMRRTAGARPGADAGTMAAGISRGAWTWIGPRNIGGRVRALVVLPTIPSTLITGGVAGGIWKSTDAGASWRVIDDFMANLAISTIVVRPGEPARLFAGTGEGFFNADSIRGAGVFVSSTEGESWLQLPSTANADFDFVNRLAFSADGGTLLAATRTGLFRSLDLGNSWTQVLAQANVQDVKFIAGSNALAVAGGRNRNAFFSTNGGQTWIASGGLVQSGSAIRVELAVSRSAPNVVYASVDENSGQIWRSNDSGATFSKVSDSAHLASQGWYDNAIWVDPTNPDHLIVGGVSVSRSFNGGLTFGGVPSCHVDQHAIVEDPGYDGASNRRVYFASDGGVCKLEDATVNVVTSLRNGLGITQFYGGAGHGAFGRVVGGTQDNGTLQYVLSAGTNNWTSQHGSDGGFSAIDPTDPNILYGEIQNFRLFRSLTGGPPSQYIYGGTGGQSCTKDPPYQITDSCNGFGNFIAPFILDPNEPNRLLAGGRSLWRSNDARTPNTASTGPSWQAIKPPVTGNSNISAIAVAPGNSDIVWVGHNNGELYVALNGTSGTPAWTRRDASPPGLPNRVVTSIAIDPIDPQVVYVSLGGFSPDSLWKTMNGGATWVDATGTGVTGLPDAPVRSVVAHPFVSGWLYAATDVGIFASEDHGTSWNLPHDGPANVAVFQLFWMDATLVAVTHGRGMYTFTPASTTPVLARRPLSQGVLPGQIVVFNVTALGVPPFTYQWYLGESGDTSQPIPGATGPTFTTPPITATARYWVRVTNALGSIDSNTATLTVIAWATLIPGTRVQNGDQGLIQSQPTNQSAVEGGHASFAVRSASPDAAYRWQFSQDGRKWQWLAEGPSARGTQTSTLVLSRVDRLMHGAQFRCVVTLAGAAQTSVAATLSVQGQAKGKR